VIPVWGFVRNDGVDDTFDEISERGSGSRSRREMGREERLAKWGSEGARARREEDTRWGMQHALRGEGVCSVVDSTGELVD